MTDELWTAYRATRSDEDRNRLAATYLPFVRSMANRMASHLTPGSLSAGDLCAEGFFGLLRSIERFDPVKGRRFLTFAQHRIRGAMLDAIQRWGHGPECVQVDADVTDEHEPRPDACVLGLPSFESMLTPLRAVDRTIITRRFRDGASVDEVARELRVKPETISVRTCYAFRILRESVRAKLQRESIAR